jgi:TRAP-type uncharacterized transport system substrate-binding protein
MPGLSLRPSNRARRGRLLLGLIVISVIVAAVWMLLTVGSLFPPSKVVMATGPEGSGQAEYGIRYQEILKRAGVELELVPTEGGLDNLNRLRDPRSGVSVALVESGLTTREESPDLVSLGTVSIEPLWIFSRSESQGGPAQKLVGKRISIEPEGSATRVLARDLLALNGIEETSVELLGLPPDKSTAALLRGEIDVVMLLALWQSPAVQKLLAADGIVLEGHPRADAYAARFPSFIKVVLPAGVADFAKNIPPADTPLVAIEASLLASRELHPAMQYLLLDAASETHAGPGIFNRAGRFPAPEAIDLPLSPAAQTYYKSGRPFMYRYLPFWLAGLVERLLIVLIPLLTIVLPITNFLPTIIRQVTERRIFKLYGELKFAETQLESTSSVAHFDQLAAALEDLERRAHRIKVPLGYAQRLYILKSHIALAQEQLEKRRSDATS